jgi:lipopolysaccharide export LptBFGC system permease protein LptF
MNLLTLLIALLIILVLFGGVGHYSNWYGPNPYPYYYGFSGIGLLLIILLILVLAGRL